jgi:hypothetical protein
MSVKQTLSVREQRIQSIGKELGRGKNHGRGIQEGPGFLYESKRALPKLSNQPGTKNEFGVHIHVPSTEMETR